MVKDNNKDKSSSNSLVFGRWPQTKMHQHWDSGKKTIGNVKNGTFCIGQKTYPAFKLIDFSKKNPPFLQNYGGK